MAFKLPFKLGTKQAAPKAAAPAVPAARPAAGGMAAARSALAGKNLRLVLVPMLVVLLVVAGVLVFFNAREAKYGALYIADAGQLRMLSQRLAKAAQQSLLGNPEAFKQISASRDAFATILDRLVRGGETLPPSPDRIQPVLEVLAKAMGIDWQTTSPTIG